MRFFRGLEQVAVLAGLLAVASPALAISGPKVPIKGKAFSANVSAAGSAGGTSVLVSAATIGPGNVFIVQSWCANTNSGYASIYTNSGQGEGNFQLVSPATCNGGMCCYNFTPGYVVPVGADLMVYTPSNNIYSNVTGVITKNHD